MSIENLTNPGAEPVEGDWIAITRPSGGVERKQYVAPAPAPTTYKVINKARYFLMVRGVSQMTNAEFAAYETDPHADMITVRALMNTVTTDIDINNSDNMDAVVEALDLMAAHGHTGQIAPADFPDAILAAWAAL
ncbi:MAG: hypothetical protein H6887_00635 [Hoeflea sp.]|nr:hypothetical protein [Hoeflea sp.]